MLKTVLPTYNYNGSQWQTLTVNTKYWANATKDESARGNSRRVVNLLSHSVSSETSQSSSSAPAHSTLKNWTGWSKCGRRNLMQIMDSKNTFSLGMFDCGDAKVTELCHFELGTCRSTSAKPAGKSCWKKGSSPGHLETKWNWMKTINFTFYVYIIIFIK